MKLSALLNSLQDITKENELPTAYIVGGLPRDRILGVPPNLVKDIDITTGDASSSVLATLVSSKWPNALFRLYDDGHSSIDFKNIRLDFSNNFKIPGIVTELKDMGIDDPSELQKELFSRDFTINTLLQPMDLQNEPLDLTGKAIIDLKAKVIRTPINPELTIGYDPRRILRALKLAIKFDFSIDKELGKTIIKYRGSLQNITLEHIKKQINQMLRINSDKTIELLSKYKLLPIIPLSKLMQLEVVKRNMIQEILDGQEIF
ncbi:MAG: hypothetical protein WC516_05545 [Patescibacteria group bacterium]|jgi:tRNA nucleotidyltransferase/poly(A) polymerase